MKAFTHLLLGMMSLVLLAACATTSGTEEETTSADLANDTLPNEEGWTLADDAAPLPSLDDPYPEDELDLNARRTTMPMVTPPPHDAWRNRQFRRIRPGFN